MPALTDEVTRSDGAFDYKVPLSFENCTITIEKKVTFERFGTFADDAAFAALKQKVIDAVNRFYNKKFQLKMTKAADREQDCPCTTIAIEVKLTEVASGGFEIALWGGKDGTSHSSPAGATIKENGATGAPPEGRPCSYGHEAGHFILGLPDEYEDNKAKTPIHKDNSVMGDYHNEGYDKAEAKERHFEFVKDWLASKHPWGSGCDLKLEKAP